MPVTPSIPPAPTGALDRETRALVHEQAAVDLGDHGVLSLRGADVVSYLQTKLTAHMPRVMERGGGAATAVDINGRLIFTAQVLPCEGGVDLVVPPGFAPAAQAHLERFVIMEDVTITDRSAALRAIVLVGGPEEARKELAAQLAQPADAQAHAQVAGGRTFSPHALPFFGRPAHWLLLSRSGASAPLPALPEDWPHVGRAARERASLLLDAPLLDLDLVAGETLPIEAGLWSAMSFTKGCYLGQEVIERLFARGRPNKRLMRIGIPGPPPPPGTPLAGTPKPAGHITRATVDLDGNTTGFAFVRRRYLDDPVPLLAGEGGPEVEVLHFVGGEAPADGGRS